MAKKRVHEIAKQRGMPSKEVIAILQKAGLDVKTAAQSIDENDIEMAFSNGGKGPKQKTETPAPRQPQSQGGPRPLGQTPAPQQPTAADGQGAERPNAPAGGASQQGGGGGGGDRPQRPTRGVPPGRDGGGAGGRRRRVVIDSQASRRQQGPPPPQQPPRRGRGRRRRGQWVEPNFSQQEEKVEEIQITKINSGATVKEVAESLGLGAADVIKKLMELGEMATMTQTLSDEAVEVLADAFDKKIEIVHSDEDVEEEPGFEDAPEDLVARPPVVTIMGHVDHGKTSLLDAIRETEVAAGEAGGITQHIGAYQVHHNDNTITFLDTPGHQAFTAMRARGASVTDIAVIVVAADDGVMPQTREAIDHAKAAEVPMIVAVNKIDKEGAAPDRVRGEMAQLGLNPAEGGGDTEFVDVSAKTKQGLEDLLDTILVVTELEELKANPDTEASGAVIESKLDPGRGPVVTILIGRGTMQVGDAIVAGAHWGRVRAMTDFTGDRIKSAGPGMPVEVLGFDGVPEAGEHVRVVENERRARQLATERAPRL